MAQLNDLIVTGYTNLNNTTYATEITASGNIIAPNFVGIATSSNTIKMDQNSGRTYIGGILESDLPSTPSSVHKQIYYSSIYTQNNVLFGAAYNDYAEYRETKEYIEPGRVICENGDDTLSLSVERL